MKNKLLSIALVLFGMAMNAQAQVKVCKSYADFMENKWSPYESLTGDKKPDSCRIKYNGVDFDIKTDDKEVNQIRAAYQRLYTCLAIQRQQTLRD